MSEAADTAYEDEWALWSTDDLQGERAEITAEIESIKSQLETSALGKAEARDYEWEHRARFAMKCRHAELARLDIFLSKLRRQERAEAHEVHQARHNAARGFRDWYMLVAARELPPEWHEFIKAKASEEMEHAADAAAQLAVSRG